MDIEERAAPLVGAVNDSAKWKRYSSNLSKLIKSYEELKQFAPKYDYKDVEGNGIRTFCQVIEKLFEKANQEVIFKEKVSAKTKDKLMKNLLNVVEVLNTMSDLIEDIVLNHRTFADELITSKMLSITERQYRSMIELKFFYLPLEIYQYYWLVSAALAIRRNKYWLLLKQSWKNKLQSKYAVNYTTKQLINYLKICESPRLLKAAQKSHPVELIKTVTIKAKSKKQIQEDGSISDIDVDNELSCVIIRDGEAKDQAFKDVLLFHCHGGGFIAIPPLSHQAYLRQIAQQMPGVTIISVDYRLAPKYRFPCALQDIVDCYLAVSGMIESNAETELGFKPSKIVVFGDSAGGNLALSMSRVLHEIQVKVPERMCLIYPVVSPSLSILAPSKVFMLIDMMLPTSFCYNMYDAYCPERSSEKSSADVPIDCSKGKEKPWFRRAGLNERINEIDCKCDDPLFNPFMGGFSQFSNTKVVIFACEYDPLLDDSIKLAKLWPEGMVELNLIKQLLHGYLLSEGEEAKKATQFTFEKIRDLIVN